MSANWKKQEALRLRFERQMRSRLIAEFKLTAKEIGSKEPLDAVISKHTSRLFSIILDLSVKAMRASAASVLGAVIKQGYVMEVKATEKELARIIYNAARRNAEMHSLNVSQTTRTQVTRAVTRGAKEGWNEDQIARDIERRVGGAVGRQRAQVIARTESHAAAQEGSIEAAKSLDIPLVKVWVAADDERTRDTHAEADGQQQGMDDPFEIGDAELAFPGDPSGPPEETINCRCVTTYQAKG